MKNKQHIVTDAESGRVDLVVQKLTGMTRKNVRELFELGQVSINDEPCAQGWARVQTGDRVTVGPKPSELERKKKLWKDPAFTIAFEDEHLIVVDKAASVLTVPASTGQTNTLVHRISSYFTQGQRKRRLAYIVHRLDQGVSGLLVFGKTQHIADQIKNQFEARKPERHYVAIVAGKMLLQQGTFRSHLATDDRLNRYSTNDEEKGELAVTHYEVKQHLDTHPPTTLVEVQLETGRRNQIRVHFAEAGHPVLGDPRYGEGASRHPQWRARRMALHARSLSFMHPVTAKRVSLESPLPAEMLKFLKRA